MFSVVVPLYNKEYFVASTLRSVLAQDEQDYELIVVDDGSTDNSLTIVRSISDPRIRVLCQRNQGVSAARNSGVRASTRPWVALLDADDLWAPNHLTTLREVIKAVPDAGFVSARGDFACRRKVNGMYPRDRPKSVEVSRINFFHWVVVNPLYFHTSSVAFQRKLFNEVGGFAPFAPGEDVEYWTRLALVTPCAVAKTTTCERRADRHGLAARSQRHVATRDLGRDNLPTPVLTLLDEVLRSGSHWKIRCSLEAYFDYRLVIGIRAAVRSGDRLRAWKLWRMMRSPYRTRALIALIAAAAPRSLIETMVSRRGRASD